MIDLTDYQKEIRRFYTPEVAANLLEYSRAALVAEVGEVVGLRAKRMRGDARYQDATAYREAVVLEMGDVLFSLASIATALGERFAIDSLFTIRKPTLKSITEYVSVIVGADQDSQWLTEDLFSELWQYTTDRRLYFETVKEITEKNITKLTDRQARGLIRGSGHGDDRR